MKTKSLAFLKKIEALFEDITHQEIIETIQHPHLKTVGPWQTMHTISVYPLSLLSDLAKNRNSKAAAILAQHLQAYVNIGVLDRSTHQKKTEQDNCPICYETYEKGNTKVTLICNHQLCTTCSVHWLHQENKTTCPFCRQEAQIKKQ